MEETERGAEHQEALIPIVLHSSDAHAALAALETLADETREHLENSKAANTRRAYKADWTDFTAWCRQHHRLPLPAIPETVALYLTHCAKGLKPSTVQRRMACISQAHHAQGHESPTHSALVRSVWQGIRREKGVAQEGKEPALTEDLRCMIQHLPEDKLLSVRDRALLLIGFAGAMRRSELVALDCGDADRTREGWVITIRKSKTDQFGEGRKVGIPFGSDPLTCPVRALEDWLNAAGIEEGPLFRSVNRHGNVSKRGLCDKSVAFVVKRAIQAAGKEGEKFAGHSLRAGLATQAAMGGASERSIQEQTGHKSLIVLRRYIRDGNLFRENAAAKTGL